MKNFFRFLCLVSSIVLMVSCSSMSRGGNQKAYIGPDLPPNETASISFEPGIKVLFVDNIPNQGFPVPSAFEILPGNHTILTEYYGKAVVASGYSSKITETKRESHGGKYNRDKYEKNS